MLCARAASLNRHNHAEKQTTNANDQHTKTTTTTLSITHHQSPPPPITTPITIQTITNNIINNQLVDIIVALEPTFGGVNLEDVRSPECFFVERECQRRMAIPVFHDDQHGTAIVAGAGEGVLGSVVGRGACKGKGGCVEGRGREGGAPVSCRCRRE